MSQETNPRRVISLVKRINGGVFSLDVDNALFGMKKPKMVFTVVQPGKDESGKYVAARFFADVPDVVGLINHVYRRKIGVATDLFKSYKGGRNTKKNCTEARVMNVSVKTGSNGMEYFTFAIENCEGEQVITKNKFGEDVNGVVKPKRGGECFARNSIGLSKDEMYYVVDMLKSELQAWRTVVNTDMFYHPDRYRFNAGSEGQSNNASNGQTTQSAPPTVQKATA